MYIYRERERIYRIIIPWAWLGEAVRMRVGGREEKSTGAAAPWEACAKKKHKNIIRRRETVDLRRS